MSPIDCRLGYPDFSYQDYSSPDFSSGGIFISGLFISGLFIYGEVISIRKLKYMNHCMKIDEAKFQVNYTTYNKSNIYEALLENI